MEDFQKQEFKSRIQLNVANVQRGKQPSVKVQVKNTAKRRVKEVEVAVYFLDSKGNRIKQKRCSTPDDELIKGGEAKAINCSLKSQPPKWTGDVEVELKDFKFGVEE